MSMPNLETEAEQNLNYHLRLNSYPGRGMVIGLDQTGNNLVQVYWVMGRSGNSRNRVLESVGGRVYTKLAQPTKHDGETELIIYNAMNETRVGWSSYFIVSNGVQTDHLSERLGNEESMMAGLDNFSYEPDQPNYTPRITGLCGTKTNGKLLPIELAMIRRPSYGFQPERFHYRYDGVRPGYGFCLTTYNGDGNPLPSFVGEPKIMPLKGGIEEIANYYWDALNLDNRVALVVKFIDPNGDSNIKIINHHQVGQPAQVKI